MVKRNKAFIIILMLFTIFTLNSSMIAKADSGWDSSYDFEDSSWDSTSSWDSGSSWSGSHYYTSSSGSIENPILTIILAIIFIGVIVFVSYISYKTNINKKIPKTIINNTNYEDISLDKAQEIINNFDINEFKNISFNIYKDIQTAWMNFDTDTIRKLTTDELYNMYNAQLTTLKIKKQQNIMKNIEYIDAKIVKVLENNGIYTIEVYLNVKCLDYIIDTKTNKTLRGKDDCRLNIEYLLTFVKSSSDDKKIEKCPNCGAPVEINSSATCSYCDTILVKTATDYVLSKKVCIGQKME